jgi:hypothetical protein
MTDKPKPTYLASQLMSDYGDVFDFIHKLERGEDTFLLFQLIRHNAEHAVNKDLTKAAQNVLRALRKFKQRLRMFEEELDYVDDIFGQAPVDFVISHGREEPLRRARDDDEDEEPRSGRSRRGEGHAPAVRAAPAAAEVEEGTVP